MHRARGRGRAARWWCSPARSRIQTSTSSVRKIRSYERVARSGATCPTQRWGRAAICSTTSASEQVPSRLRASSITRPIPENRSARGSIRRSTDGPTYIVLTPVPCADPLSNRCPTLRSNRSGGSPPPGGDGERPTVTHCRVNRSTKPRSVTRSGGAGDCLFRHASGSVECLTVHNRCEPDVPGVRRKSTNSLRRRVAGARRRAATGAATGGRTRRSSPSSAVCRGRAERPCRRPRR